MPDLGAPELAVFTVLLDAMPGYALIVDEGHRIVAANERLRSLTGLAASEVAGAFCPQVVHGLQTPFPGCPLEESLAHGGTEVLRDILDPSTGRWVRSGIFPVAGRTFEGRRVFLHTARDVTDEVRTADENRKHVDTFHVIASLLRLALSGASLSGILAQALDAILSLEWLALESCGGVFLADDQGSRLTLAATRGMAPDIVQACASIPFGHCLCGLAASRGRLEHRAGLDADHAVRTPHMRPHGHYCAPMMSDSRCVGVLCLYLPAGHASNEADERVVASIADALAGIVVRVKADEREQASAARLRVALSGTVEVLARTVESRDPYTAGHQRRVADLAAAIAARLGLDAERIEGLRLAGKVHDLGKNSIPAEILSKPTRLSSAEFRIIQSHVEIGYDILAGIEFPWPIAEMVVQHHERMDGTGYPHGLAGDAILLEARILCVADAVEAMASDRPYRPALGLAFAMAEIRKLRGAWFDPRVVDVCLELIERDGYSLDG